MGQNRVYLIPGDTGWQVPAGVRKINVYAWGGSGAGGIGKDNGDGSAAAGGGAGGAACIAAFDVEVTPGETISVEIGNGGSISGPDAGGNTTLTALACYVQANGTAAGAYWREDLGTPFGVEKVWFLEDSNPHGCGWSEEGFYICSDSDLRDGQVYVFADAAAFMTYTGISIDPMAYPDQVMGLYIGDWVIKSCHVNSFGLIDTMDSNWQGLGGGDVSGEYAAITASFPGSQTNSNSYAFPAAFNLYLGQNGKTGSLSDGPYSGPYDKPDGGHAANSDGDWNAGSLNDGGNGGFWYNDFGTYGPPNLPTAPGGGGAGGAMSINGFEAPTPGAAGMIIIEYDDPVVGASSIIPSLVVLDLL